MHYKNSASAREVKTSLAKRTSRKISITFVVDFSPGEIENIMSTSSDDKSQPLVQEVHEVVIDINSISRLQPDNTREGTIENQNVDKRSKEEGIENTISLQQQASESSRQNCFSSEDQEQEQASVPNSGSEQLNSHENRPFVAIHDDDVTEENAQVHDQDKGHDEEEEYKDLDFSSLLQEADDSIQQLQMYAADDTTNREQSLSGGAVSGVSKTLAAVKSSSNSPVNTILLESIDRPNRKKGMEEEEDAANSSTDQQADLSNSAIFSVPSSQTPLTSNLNNTFDDDNSEQIDHISITDDASQCMASYPTGGTHQDPEDSVSVNTEKSRLWFIPTSFIINAKTNIGPSKWWASGAALSRDNSRPQDVGPSTTGDTVSTFGEDLLSTLENKHEEEEQKLVIRHADTGCTAVQLGEETVRVTIRIPQTTVRSVMTSASNPDLVHVWCESVVAANITNEGSRRTGSRVGGNRRPSELGTRPAEVRFFIAKPSVCRMPERAVLDLNCSHGNL